MNGLSTYELIMNAAVNRRLSKDGLYFHLKVIQKKYRELESIHKKKKAFEERRKPLADVCALSFEWFFGIIYDLQMMESHTLHTHSYQKQFPAGNPTHVARTRELPDSVARTYSRVRHHLGHPAKLPGKLYGNLPGGHSAVAWWRAARWRRWSASWPASPCPRASGRSAGSCNSLVVRS